MSPSLWEKIKSAFMGGDEVLPMTAPPVPSTSLFAMKIEDVFSISGVGVVVTGKVEAGSVSTGDKIVVRSAAGNERRCRVVDIEKFRRKLDQAKTGDNVGIVLSGVEKSQIARGDVLANA